MKRSFSSAMRSPVVPIPPVLPVGYRFNPSDEELIRYYLVMLLSGLYSYEMPIGIVNFLEFDPWDLPGESKVESHEVWYFFSQRVVYMERKKKMYKRKTRSGHWSLTRESIDVKNLGKRNTLRLYKDSPKQITDWLAYEYEIAPNSFLPNPDEFVIIKLTNSPPEKRSKRKTNTGEQNLQETLISGYDGSTSLDEVMTMSNCYGHEVSADFGNQNEANTTDMPTYYMSQQCIQKGVVRELMPAIFYGSHVVSPDYYGHENPKEMSVMSTYDNGESSSNATSGHLNHSSVPVYCPTRDSPYIPENQEDCIFASDFENQNLPSEVEDFPTKPTPPTENQYEIPKLPSGNEDIPSQATPHTENQFTPEETNLSCSMTSKPEYHFQNQEFNSSFLEDGDFCFQMDLDAEVLADMDAFHELMNSPNPTIQHATCLDQYM